MKKYIIALATVASVGIAQGAIINTSEAASFTVANDDLLQTSLASVNASALNDRDGGTDTAFFTSLTGEGVTVGEASLRDGAWYDHDYTADWGVANLELSNTESRGSALAENNEFAEYSLDLVASPLGYNIDTIDLYSNWGSLGGRDEINVTITASLVATPTVFDQVIVTGATYNPTTKTQAKMSITDINLSGIAGVKFLWPDGQENNGVGYSELDVIGAAIPEPATLGMVVAFGGGILFIRRRFMM